MFGDGGDPQYTGSIPPTPTEPVQSGALGAPGQSPYQSGGGYSGGTPSYGGAGAGVQSSPLDRPATGQPMYGAASGGQSGDGRSVTLGAGETLDTISRRYSVPRQALMDVNGINDANAVRPGQQLVIPTYSASRGGWVAPLAAPSQPASQATYNQPSYSQPAQPAARSSSASSAASAPAQPRADKQAGSTHRVQPGETVYSIGRAYNVSPNAIIAANDLDNPNNVRIGTDLVIPGAGSQQAAAQPRQSQPSQSSLQPQTMQQQAAAKEQQSQPQSQPQQQSQPASQAAAPQAKPEPQKNTQVAMAPSSGQTANDAGVSGTQAMAGGTFRWPVRGRVISAFGDKGNGGKNDGINISVPAGTAVRAAEDGTVAYAGNELKGYGNLVLIRHKGDWVTAYAHNSEIMVQRGDTVNRGQVIAKAGQSGSVNAPQVHFEVRRNSTPVDPLKYLSDN